MNFKSEENFLNSIYLKLLLLKAASLFKSTKIIKNSDSDLHN